MNIFVLDRCPYKAARYQCDRHVVKMVLETAQLLCTAFDQAPYKKTHVNHPCAVWTRQARDNYTWLLHHGMGLAYEYTERYGKTHKSLSVIEWCDEQRDTVEFPQLTMTPFAQAMPDQYKHADPVVAYRNYYIHDKAKIAQWKYCETPDWMSFVMTVVIL
jgi:hypothetical protein